MTVGYRLYFQGGPTGAVVVAVGNGGDQMVFDADEVYYNGGWCCYPQNQYHLLPPSSQRSPCCQCHSDDDGGDPMPDDW